MTQETATTIRSQIGRAALMSLGAHNLGHGTVDGMPSLIFTARILPFNANGSRSTTPRKMLVTVSLNANDLYNVNVSYPQRGDKFGLRPYNEHYNATDIHAEDLAALMLSLDYDGPTATNPRF